MTSLLRSLPAALVLSVPAAAQILPERPALHREVTGIVDVGGPLENDHDARFQRPHLPANRTTQDGRLAMTVDLVPRFSLLAPEKLDRVLRDASPGAEAASWDGEAFLGGDPVTQSQLLTAGTGREIVHACLWDDELPTANAAAQDVYRVKVLVTTREPSNPGSIQLFVTPVRVTVDRPKSRFARISEIALDGATLAGPDYAAPGPLSFRGTAFEPTIAGDGRLIVFRVRSHDYPTPSGPAGIDIVYSYYEDPTGALGTANPQGWTQVFPIAHAHHDPRLAKPVAQGGFGFAQYPLTDAAGNSVAPYEDLGATYPWIDRSATNLFFTTVGDTLHFQDANPQYPNRDPRSEAEWRNTRYETVGVPGDPRERWGQESFELFQGAAFAGLWSHGRIVQVDNLLNDMDFAVGSSRASTYGQMPYNVGPQQRLVRLYRGSPTPSLDPAGGWVRLGYGRANESPALPAGENTNTSILDSIENKLAYRRHIVPETQRDVVWHVSNGKHTDEVVFDDHVDPDALIVCDMVGAVTLPDTSGNGFNDLVHHSGWDAAARSFAREVRLQNAATYTERWTVAPMGVVRGSGWARGRLEPVALGGVRGKGLWLEGGVGLAFDAPRPAHPGVSAPTAFYAGIFVDCRFADDGKRRPLLRFPDGTGVELYGRHQVLLTRGSDVVHRTTLPDGFTYTDSTTGGTRTHEFLPEGGWTHLGFEVEDSGRRVTLFVDGFAFDRWQGFGAGVLQPLSSAPGAEILVAGIPDPAVSNGTIFRGWIDELRLFAHGVDVESAANHAHATIAALGAPTSSSSWHDQLAARYPSWAHDEVTEALRARGEATHVRYVALVDHATDGPARRPLPAGATALRASLHFPEGPLFWDAPRPDSTGNVFCTTCHHPGARGGLSLEALEHRAVVAARDARRQPSQPPAFIGGVVPNRLFDAGAVVGPLQGQERPHGDRPVPVDLWMLERFGARVATVESVTLVDADTGADVAPLRSGDVLDPTVVGADSVDLRVALDVGQGELELALRDSNGALLAATSLQHGPYSLFGASGSGGSSSGFDLVPGSYRLEVTPVGGATVTLPFSVVGTAPRTVARYRDAYQPGATRDGWMFARARAGVFDPTGYVSLAYEPTSGRFDADGLTSSGLLHLGATGGRPGQGTTQGAGVEEAVMVGYRVPRRGYYLPRALGATTTQGGDVTVVSLHASPSLATLFLWRNHLPGPSVASGPTLCQEGDVLWFAVAPGANDNGDDFTWDFEIEYSETTWAGVAD